jgi:hypothetical protein
MDAVFGHQSHGGLQRRLWQDGDRIGRHPLAHAGIARVHALAERPQQVTRREDADQAPVVDDDR